MILLQIMEFIKNYKRIIPVSIICSLVAIMISLIYGMLANEKNRISPFEELKNEQGFVIFGEEIESLASDANEILNTVNKYEVLFDENYISVLVVDDWTRPWKPRLSEGSFVYTKNNTNIIPIIVGNDYESKYKLGDRLIGHNINGEELAFEVTGKVALGASVLAPCEEYKFDKFDYRMAYSSYDELYFMCMNRPILRDSEYLMEEGLRIAIVDDISEKEYALLYNEVRRKTGGSCIEISDFIGNTNAVYREKMITYIPIVVMGVIVSLICCFSAMFINYRYGIKHYAIYYMVGCNPRQLLKLVLSSGIGIEILSIIFVGGALIVSKNLHMFDKYLIYISKETYLVMGAFYLLFLFFLVIVSMVSLKSLSPREMLLKTKR